MPRSENPIIKRLEDSMSNHPFAVLGTAVVLGLGLAGAIGGATGWIGGQILTNAGYDLDDADYFGYVGLIGGATLPLACLPAVFNSRNTRGFNTSNTAYYFTGLAVAALLGFAAGIIGAGTVLSFNDTLMSNLEQNERILTGGAVCATGACALYMGLSALAAPVYVANKVVTKCKT